jgi:hypothetical protein
MNKLSSWKYMSHAQRAVMQCYKELFNLISKAVYDLVMFHWPNKEKPIMHLVHLIPSINGVQVMGHDRGISHPVMDR